MEGVAGFQPTYFSLKGSRPCLLVFTRPWKVYRDLNPNYKVKSLTCYLVTLYTQVGKGHRVKALQRNNQDCLFYIPFPCGVDTETRTQNGGVTTLYVAINTISTKSLIKAEGGEPPSSSITIYDIRSI